MKAEEILRAFVPEIDRRIAVYLDRELHQGFGFNDRQKKLVKSMLLHTKEYILRPTKRLRASFVNYGYMLSGKVPDERVWEAAVGVELVHAALLMHDDFMDQDRVRRGGPTTHEYFGGGHIGEAMAVSLGDAILCLGFELVPTKQMLRAIADTAYGQAYDVSLQEFGKWTEDDVITLHKAKTAIYTYENPLFIGAQMAGLKGQVFEVLHEYAMNGGVAFQLRDDILGVFGDPSETGKSADSDLRQGKRTLLVLKALKHPAVKKIRDLEAAKKAIIETGSYEYSRQMTKKYAQKAVEAAEKLRKLKLNAEAVDYLQGIAQYMVEREV